MPRGGVPQLNQLNDNSAYLVAYYKPADSPQLLARWMPKEDDPRVPMRVSAFLASAWKLAKDEAKELGWIVEGRRLKARPTR